ncbi:MAG: cache domain-containing protein [Patescibacteria group bacterium]
MSLFFFSSNIHFALEILGALAFLILAWLAFDALRIRRDFLTVSRGIGFVLLAIGIAVHAFQFGSDIVQYGGHGARLAGILFIVWNLFLERPAPRPEFKVIVVLPGIGAALGTLNAAAAIGFFIIALLAYRQYRFEFKKALRPFWLGFLSIAVGTALGAGYGSVSQTPLWIIGHFFEFTGFAFLGRWVWSYLALRIREEMLIIFVSFTLVMAVLVTLTFSSILIGRMEAQTREELMTDTRVFDFAIRRLLEEALAKARVIGTSPELIKAVGEEDFAAIAGISEDRMAGEHLGLLTILDRDGEVMARAGGLVRKGENLSADQLIRDAKNGLEHASVGRIGGDGFSVYGVAPIRGSGDIIGAVVAGFPLDNAFADGVQKITGLNVSVFDGATIAGTTLRTRDGRTRHTGIRETNPAVLKAVLRRGQALALRTTILSRPFLASYVPLAAWDGKTVGMLSAAKPQHELLATAQAANRLTLVAVVILMLLFVSPIYALTKRLAAEVRA